MLRYYNNVVLGLVVASICGLAWWFDHRRLSGELDRIDQQQAAIGKLLSKASIDWDNCGNPVGIEFSHTCTDQDLENLGLLNTVRAVRLAYCFQISDRAIERLVELPHLQILDLYRNNPIEHNNFTNGYDLTTQPVITDKSLESIAKIESLKELYLWDNQFSEEGIRQLRSLPNLKILGFRSRLVSQAAVGELKRVFPNTEIQN